MNNKLILSNFHPQTTKEEIADIFRDYGLENVFLKEGKYAVLTFTDEGEAGRAMIEWRGVVFWGYWPRLKHADSMDEQPRRRRRKPRWDDDD